MKIITSVKMFASYKVLFVFSAFVVAAYGAQSRISGGTDAEPNSSPWSASIQVGVFNPTHICGGSIIGNRYILTAGHCGYSVIGSWIGVITQVVYVRVGSNYLSSGGSRYLLYSGTIHPDFHPTTGFANLAILESLLTINFNNVVFPIPLQTTTPLLQEPATVAGWGALSAGGLNSERLQFLTTYTISHSDCTFLAQLTAQSQNINIPAIYEEREICTFHSYGTGSCNGDQGNGLVNPDGFLIGTLSWAFACGSGGPEVFTRTDAYIPWIQSVIN